MELKGEWDPQAKRKLPPTLGPALVRTGKAVACLAAYFAMKTYFPVELLETATFFSSSIFYRRVALPAQLCGTSLCGQAVLHLSFSSRT